MLNWVSLHDYSARMSALSFGAIEHVSGCFHACELAPPAVILHKILNLSNMTITMWIFAEVHNLGFSEVLSKCLPLRMGTNAGVGK